MPVLILLRPHFYQQFLLMCFSSIRYGRDITNIWEKGSLQLSLWTGSMQPAARWMQPSPQPHKCSWSWQVRATVSPWGGLGSSSSNFGRNDAGSAYTECYSSPQQLWSACANFSFQDLWSWHRNGTFFKLHTRHTKLRPPFLSRTPWL